MKKFLSIILTMAMLFCALGVQSACFASETDQADAEAVENLAVENLEVLEGSEEIVEAPEVAETKTSSKLGSYAANALSLLAAGGAAIWGLFDLYPKYEKVNETTKANEELRQKLTNAEENLKTANEEKENLEVNIKGLNEQLEEKDGLINDLNSKKDTCESQLSTANGNWKNAKSEIGQLKEDLKTANEEKENLEANIKGLNEQLKEKENSITSLNKQLNNLTKEKDGLISGLKAEKDTCESQLSTANKNWENAKSEIGKLEGQLSEKDGLINDLNSKKDTCESQLSTANAGWENAKSEIGKLEGQLSEKDSLIAELDEINIHLGQMENQVNIPSNPNEGYPTRFGKIEEAFNKQISDLTEQNKKLEDENSKLQSTIDDNKKICDDARVKAADDYAHKLEKARADLDYCNGNSSKISQDLDLCKVDFKKIKEQLTQSQGDYSLCLKTTESKEEKIKTLTETKTSNEAKIKHLEDRNKLLINSVNGLIDVNKNLCNTSGYNATQCNEMLDKFNPCANNYGCGWFSWFLSDYCNCGIKDLNLTGNLLPKD